MASVSATRRSPVLITPGCGRRRTALVGTRARNCFESLLPPLPSSVVVGNRGMTGMRRFVLGSVPNKVAHNCPVSVLIVDTSQART